MSRYFTFVVAIGLMLVFGAVSPAAEKKPTLPDGAHGFAGSLTGKVIEGTRDGRMFIMEVTAVAAGEKSKASNPQSLVGKRVHINVQWVKGEGEHAKWHPVEAQVHFVKSLKRGQKVTIDVINDEAARLHITKLPG